MAIAKFKPTRSELLPGQKRLVVGSVVADVGVDRLVRLLAVPDRRGW